MSDNNSNNNNNNNNSNIIPAPPFSGRQKMLSIALSNKPSHQRTFSMLCKNACLATAKQYYTTYKTFIDISANHELLFRDLCAGGHLVMARWLMLLNPDIDISAQQEDAFRRACRNGHLDVVEWLVHGIDVVTRYDTTYTPPRKYWTLFIKKEIDISIGDEAAFCAACEYGQLHIIQWLVNEKPDILSIRDVVNRAMNKARCNGHTHIIMWIREISSGLTNVF